MKYHQPYGVSDPNASYINGDPSIGRPGSIPDAGSIEYPQREITNFISVSDLTPQDGDLLQLAKSARRQFINFANDIGTLNALKVTMTPALNEYSLGLPVRVRVALTNTGPATLDCGPGVKSIKRGTGAALEAGDLPAGMIAQFVYDGTNFQLQNFTAIGGTGGTTNNTFVTKIPFAVDSGTVNAIVANFSPAITVLNDGDTFLVRLSNAPTGATTLKPNALTARPLKTRDGANIAAGMISVGEELLVVWESTLTQFRLIGVSSAAASSRFNNLQTYFNAGSYSWTVPASVFQIFYEIWGGGGGGGGGITLNGGGPGGGGGYVAGYLAVTPGQAIPLVIGAGGAAVGANSPVTGGNGGSSSFAGIATAHGGFGGPPNFGWANPGGGAPGEAVGGMLALRGIGAGGQANEVGGTGNYPVSGGGARLGTHGGPWYQPLPACGGAPGLSVYPGYPGSDGACFIHY